MIHLYNVAGLDSEGIYRISGFADDVEALKNSFDKGNTYFRSIGIKFDFMKVQIPCFTDIEHHIYSIKHPGRLLNFWTLRVGAYSRWAFIRGWALIKFSPFSASSKFIFATKQ